MIINEKMDPNIELKISDWELDFYSRPIIEENGKKRWELIISSTKSFRSNEIFLWNKICPANEVNSIWLTKALKEAVSDAKKKGFRKGLGKGKNACTRLCVMKKKRGFRKGLGKGKNACTRICVMQKKEVSVKAWVKGKTLAHGYA